MNSDELRDQDCNDECSAVRWKAADEIDRLSSKTIYTDDEGHDHDVSKVFTEWKQLRALMAIARCPNTDCIDGSIPVQVSDNDWEAQQCQWCFERAAIIYGTD